MKPFNIFYQRSVHFMPAIKVGYLEHLHKSKYKPDILVLDLEDSIAENTKNEARDILKKTLNSMNQKEMKSACRFLAYRVNAIDSEYFQGDIKIAKNPKIKVVIVPKVETIEDIRKVKMATNKPIGICIETIKGLLNADKFLPELSVENGDFVIVGHEDPSADYNIERPKHLDIPNPLTHFILQTLTIAKCHGFPVVDGPSRFIDDLKHLKKESMLTKSWGCVAKCTIHPDQIKIVNDIFDKASDVKRISQNLKILTSLKDGTMAARNTKGDMMDMPSKRMYAKYKKS